MRALLSVYDKTGIVELARALTGLGWEIVSTGGTLAALRKAGVEVRSVSDITDFPEIMDGRVKTLHPLIHGGLLGRPELEGDQISMGEHGIELFGLLAVNLYPFVETITKPDVTELEAIEQIDIGGPAMLRAAAKNHQHVIPVVEPGDYPAVVDALRAGGPDLATRRSLAAKVYAQTSAYDASVARYFRRDDSLFPEEIAFAGRKTLDLRYGENPHQHAAAYQSDSFESRAGVIGSKQLHGKELSFNNLLDADAAWNCVQGWDRPAVAIIKHTIPCGLAVSDSLVDAYERALAGDPVSAFGGIVASNSQIDEETATEVSKLFCEVLIAPGFSEPAMSILEKKKNLRLLEAELAPEGSHGLEMRVVSGGWLIQEADDQSQQEETWKVVSNRRPTESEMNDLRFAWRVVRHVKSNAIVLAKNQSVVGVGSGQPNRVESVAIAARKAGRNLPESVLASDAFFPFADGVETAAVGGVTAVIQPGGSVRDQEVIGTVNAYGMAMILTGQRHFRH